MKPVARMNLKPVMGDSQAHDPSKVLRRLKAELHKRIKQKIEDTAFSSRAKIAFRKAVQIRVMPHSLLIMTKHPGFIPAVKGRLKQQMYWLTKAKRPIPIVTKEGELIFRWATTRSMANGRWVHPGRNPNTFLDRAKKEARKFIKEKISKEVLKQVRAALMSK